MHAFMNTIDEEKYLILDGDLTTFWKEDFFGLQIVPFLMGFHKIFSYFKSVYNVFVSPIFRTTYASTVHRFLKSVLQ